MQIHVLRPLESGRKVLDVYQSNLDGVIEFVITMIPFQFAPRQNVTDLFHPMACPIQIAGASEGEAELRLESVRLQSDWPECPLLQEADRVAPPSPRHDYPEFHPVHYTRLKTVVLTIIASLAALQALNIIGVYQRLDLVRSASSVIAHIAAGAGVLSLIYLAAMPFAIARINAAAQGMNLDAGQSGLIKARIEAISIFAGLGVIIALANSFL